ncbi:MAG TPA: glycosyltransferase family 2 protein [Terriglobia bacterium]|nr:glycosyltransferase family 2 protein [Terriglobia bacterium]
MDSDGVMSPHSEPDLELTILMPCLNEAETVGKCVQKAQSFLRRYGVRGEVLVSDNGSQDGSPEIACRAGARVVNAPTRGYGAALIYGTLAARGKYVIMGDADESYDFGELLPFLDQLRAGADLVIGNRFRGGIKAGAMPWANRWIGTPALSGVGRLFFRSQLGDFNCGLRACTRTAFQKLDLRTTGMEFASEMIVKATLLGLKIAEVPTTLDPTGRSRPPHLRPWRDGWRHLRSLLMYSPRWLFLYPGLAMIAVGLAGCGWLLPKPGTIGNIGFDIHTLLYAFVAIELGAQFVAFAVFAKVFAISAGLLPKDARLSRLLRYVTLEAGLVVGALLTLAGLCGSVLAVSDWGRANFGMLDASHMLRLVFPSVFSLMLGVEVICGSFFLSILGLGRQ